MAKILARVTGDFMLSSPIDRFEIEAGRPYIVPACTFCDHFASLGRLNILRTDLPDTANDADWKGFWVESKGNLDLAIESYMSTLEVVEEEAPKPKASHRAKKAHD